MDTGSTVKQATITALLEKWEHQAKRKFMDANNAKSLNDKRSLENSAIVTFNCGRDLAEVSGLKFPRGE